MQFIDVAAASPFSISMTGIPTPSRLDSPQRVGAYCKARAASEALGE